VIRPGPRWAVLAFPLAGALLCWEAFRPGYVLLPTALESLAPWNQGAAAQAGRASNPLMNDSLLITLPARLYNHRMLRQGELPFWNPHIFCGYPHLALIQNNALYPVTLPFDLLDPVAGIGYAAFLHLALAGLLMYAFLRRSGLGRGAAVVGGLAFELNGMFLVRLGAPSYVYSGTWLPLMLLGARAVLDGRGGRARWALPAGIALSVLGGHPQITMLAMLLTAAYLLWHALAVPRASGRGTGHVLAAASLLAVAGLGLTGYQLVPFLELVAHSARDAVPLRVYRHSATPPFALVQALVPDAFGNPVDGTYWFDLEAHLLDGVGAGQRFWGFNYTGQNLYTGVAPLALALFALRRSRRRADVALFGLVTLASLCVLFGTPLLDLAWAAVPGFRHSRPDRVVFLYVTAIAVLAAYGYEAPSGPQAHETAPRAGQAARLAALVMAALLAWVVLAPLFGPERAGILRWLAEAAPRWAAQPRVKFQAAVAALIAAGSLLLVRRRGAGRRGRILLAAALVVLPNLYFGWRYNPGQPEPRVGRTPEETALLARTDAARFARVLAGPGLFLPPNLGQLLGLDDVHGASAAGLEPYLRLMQAADPGAVVGGKYFLAFRDPRVAATPLLRLLAVESVASDAPLPLPSAPAAAGPVALFRNPGFVPRFHLVSRVEPYQDVKRARERLLSPAFDPRATALVLASQEVAAVAPVPNAPAAPSPVSVRRLAAHEIELEVDSQGGGLLVTSEAAYPGWASRLDGRPVETLLVNTAFRGVAVPPGRHRVTMEYVPRSFRAGLALSVAALLAMAVALARGW